MTEDQTPFERFEAAYAAGDSPPWDSGIVPPEVVALVGETDAPPPGRAVDIGCGTGVSSVFLARHGWQVTGVDWVERAVALATERAHDAGLSGAQARFLQGDVTAPDFLHDHPSVTLWLDIGCLHSFSREAQAVYAGHAARLVQQGGLLRLYAWREHERDGRLTGMTPACVAALFSPAFRVEDVVLSEDSASQVRPSAWYLLRRV
jgi:SAM-dependent methyltransferase